MVGQLCWSCTRASGNSRASERYCTRVDICIHHKFVRPSALSARHLLDSFHPCPHHRIQVAYSPPAPQPVTLRQSQSHDQGSAHASMRPSE